MYGEMDGGDTVTSWFVYKILQCYHSFLLGRPQCMSERAQKYNQKCKTFTGQNTQCECNDSVIWFYCWLLK